MTRYRAEIYDPKFNFISYGAVSDKDIKIDYLAEEISVVTIPAIIEASLNDYIALRQDGQIYMHGIISDVSYDQNVTKISFVHLMSKLSVDVQVDPDVFEETYVEEWLHDKLIELYAGSDDYQNIYGFSCSYNSETLITYARQTEASEEGTTQLENLNLFQFAQDLLQKYNIMLTWDIDFALKTVTCTIDTLNTNNIWNLKLGIADTPDYTIDIHSVEGTYNKIKYYDNEDVTNTITYYLHSDGTIDSDSTSDRLSPVTYTEKTAQADATEGAEKTFAEVALTDAEASMLNTDYNHEIIVTFNATSNLISVGRLGQLYKLITPEGVAYSSVLTGFEEVNVKYLKLVFGYIRTNLTTILKMQRRKG